MSSVKKKVKHHRPNLQSLHITNKQPLIKEFSPHHSNSGLNSPPHNFGLNSSFDKQSSAIDLHDETISIVQDNLP